MHEVCFIMNIASQTDEERMELASPVTMVLPDVDAGKLNEYGT